MPNKSELLNIVIKNITKQLDLNKDSMLENIDASIKAEGPMQSHHDMQKMEYSYLVNNYTERIKTLTNELELLKNLDLPSSNESVQIAHIIIIKELQNSTIKKYFILPISIDGSTIFTKNDTIIISSNSPIGKSLLNKKLNDAVTIETPSGNKELKIIEIE